MRKYKSDFNINTIGLFRFYSGIVIGIILSFLLDQFFLKLIAMSDILEVHTTGLRQNSLIKHPTFFYSYFWSLFSISLAFSFTIYMWTSKPVLRNRRESRLNRMAQANAFFIFGVVFLSISRLLQFYIGFPNVEVNLRERLGSLIFILPGFVFLYNWQFVSRIYYSTKPILISTLVFLAYGLILSAIKT